MANPPISMLRSPKTSAQSDLTTVKSVLLSFSKGSVLIGELVIGIGPGLGGGGINSDGSCETVGILGEDILEDCTIDEFVDISVTTVGKLGVDKSTVGKFCVDILGEFL